ncbi:hypothetical protein BCV69DRAFT_282031 [Microstroma glucosiphilum]|uniref:RRM Nup35-type domain-containing protein n=1 Tax=Pseudomicrostroma glucosiphilum TaxID=1684307 RepID=A0A316U7R9_9BASI|nr:hypothetical protein BCV69DRAFT_282031 [Pseudomicrostroma glucosiphilum]PWN21296.1 hypothetical protein BCV69DRAFT_282031 [Pseudomicrostroma glucosiphilum]
MFSFNQQGGGGAQQQPQQQQQPGMQPQGQPQQGPTSSFALSSSFSSFGNFNQQQQQPPQQRPAFGSPMTVQELGNQGQGQGQQQQQQPGQGQPGQQHFGGYGQQQSSQYQSSPFSGSTQQQPQQQQSFGYDQSQSQPQSQHQPWNAAQSFSASQFQQQPPYGQSHSSSPFNSSGMQMGNNSTFAGQDSSYHQNQQPQMQQTTYLPGYLSRIKGSGHSTRPYSASAAASRSNDPHSPPKESDSAPATSATPNQHSGRLSRDGSRSSAEGLGQPTSPMQGFSSSFFSSPSGVEGGGSTRGAQSESMFGAGGLRGSTARRGTPGGRGDSRDAPFGTPARDPRSSSLLRASSVGSPPGNSSLNGGADDDDAPPFEALADADVSRPDFGSSSFAMADSSMGGPATSTSPPRNGGLYPSPSMSQVLTRPSSTGPAPSGADSSLCTLLLYGFSSSLTSTVLSHFGGIGDIVSSSSLAPSSDGSASSECLRVVYSAPQFALRALRRSGELVAGVAYVGVRFADEGLHREVLLNGINSNMLLSAAGASSSASLGLSPSNAPAMPVSNGTTSSSSALSRPTRESTPSFGRPINIVDSPAAALRARANPNGAPGSSSPFGKVGSLFGAGVTGSGSGGSGAASGTGTPVKAGANGAQGPATPGGSVMGRIGDAIFGW